MGKRKRATKPPPKKKTAKLPKIFDCPFCWHEKSVECYIQRDDNLGKIECRVCGVKFTCNIHSLDEEIDVYSKWIDACEEANTKKSTVPQSSKTNLENKHSSPKSKPKTIQPASPGPLLDDADDLDHPDSSGEVDV